MSSLPFISHRLFAAAIGHADRAPARPSRSGFFGAPAAAHAVALPLELVEDPKPMPKAATRPLRVTEKGRGAG